MEKAEIAYAYLLEIGVLIMSSQNDLLFNELQRCEAKDEVLSFVMEKTRAMATRLRFADSKVEVPPIILVDFSEASESLRKSIYFVDNCKVLIESPSLIVVNAAWLLELEAALRSFDLAGSLLNSQYLKSDGHMFTLVELIGADPVGHLSRLRKLAPMQDKDEGTDIVTQLTMLVLFFIGHELGHLLTQKGQRQFTSSLEPDAPLEQKVTNAVIKLCRHTDEFAKYGFGLPGFEEATQEESKIRQKEVGFRKEMTSWRTLYENVTEWFGDEIVADRTGIEIMLNYIKDVKKEGGLAADLYQYLLVKALFVAAVYSWYKDLHTFSEKIGFRILDSRTLMIEMMKDRRQYIKVASLFGDVHRFTLLRSNLAIESILKSEDWYEKKYLEQGQGQDNLRTWWQSESLKRYMLLCIIMDTAVKMAYVGCSTGWILDADKARGTPQLLFMSFEPIDVAVRRLGQLKLRKFDEEKE